MKTIFNKEGKYIDIYPTKEGDAEYFFNIKNAVVKKIVDNVSLEEGNSMTIVRGLRIHCE